MGLGVFLLKKNPHLNDWGVLLRDINKEIITLLFNRYLFRAIQEIIRRNDRLQNAPRSFTQWTQVLYAVTNGVAVRRLSSQSYVHDDVNFVRLLDMIIPHAAELYGSLKHHVPADLDDHRYDIAKQKDDAEQRQMQLCKRLIGRDRKLLLKATAKTVHFASKRVAHHNTVVPVRTTYADLDHAIDTLRTFAEKYMLLIYGEKEDLSQEMIKHKLPKGWDEIFLEPWATRSMLALRLGEIAPPDKPSKERLTYRPSRKAH